MHSYSYDLRARIVAAYERGEGSVRALAEQFEVDPSTVQRYRRLCRSTGDVAPRPHGGGVERALSPRDLRALEALRAAHNDRTDAEYAEALAQRTGACVSARTINRTWGRLGITRKKKSTHRRRA